MYTKIPLASFKVKKEVIMEEGIFVYNFHQFAVMAYKSKFIFKNAKRNERKFEIIASYAAA
jgi:hypothetical protein